MDKLLVVTDVIVVPGKGLVLLPGLADEPHGLDVGSKLELARPDGSRLVARVVALDYVAGTIRVCVPFEAPVGPGTEVWLDHGESGIILRATGEDAAHRAHRPKVARLHIVPAGMLLAGGDGRRR
jgi:hypothetical protein